MFRASAPAACLALLLATSAAIPASAQLTPAGEPFLVSSSGYAYVPEAVSLGSEGFAVVWSEGTPQAQQFDFSGSPLASQFELSEDPISYRYHLRTKGYANGKFLVAWHDFRVTPDEACLRVRKVEDGSQVSTVPPTCGPGFERPAVAGFPDGGFVLGWDAVLEGPDAQEVRARVYDAEGSPGGSFRVSAPGYGPSDRRLIDVGAWQDGFLVVWRDNPPDSTASRIRGRRFHRSGESLGGSFPISDRIEPWTGADFDGRVAVNPTGRSVIAWSEQISAGGTDRLIRARIYDEAGESLGPPFVVYRPGPEESARRPTVAIDSAGNFVVAWQGRACEFPCVTSLLKARLFDRQGNPRGAVADVDRGRGSPKVAMSDGGSVIFTYNEGDIILDPVMGRVFRAETQTTCMPDERTLCLNDGRFQVRVDWEKPNGEVGIGRVVPAMSADTGIFWFFNAANWELLVKVLNGCARTGNYWVFSAATTNVRYELTVTDMLTQQRRTYVNQQGVAAPAVTDTAAFATCP